MKKGSTTKENGRERLRLRGTSHGWHDERGAGRPALRSLLRWIWLHHDQIARELAGFYGAVYF